jgi:hypothetical protein
MATTKYSNGTWHMVWFTNSADPRGTPMQLTGITDPKKPSWVHNRLPSGANVWLLPITTPKSLPGNQAKFSNFAGQVFQTLTPGVLAYETSSSGPSA